MAQRVADAAGVAGSPLDGISQRYPVGAGTRQAKLELARLQPAIASC